MAINAGMSWSHAFLIVCLVPLVHLAAAGERQIIPPALPDVFRGNNYGRADPTEKIFNVLDFGAVADGKKDSAIYFIRTWIAACRGTHTGKSRVLIPEGTFKAGPVIFQGPCTCAKPIIVEIKGTVLGANDLSLYEEPYWILFEKVDGVVITGRGTLDGQGSSVWKNVESCRGSECTPLPPNLKFMGVTNGVIRGINSLNPKGVHIFITNSQNIRVRRVHIEAPGTSPNTDGIHISNSNNVRIARTHISTGDDCVGMIQGSTNVAINKVFCGPGHGISVGSLGKYDTENDVRGIIVKNCTFANTDNGIRIKSWPGSQPSQATGMIFQDLIMENVRNPIIIDQEYGCSDKCNKAPSKVKISNVHYINVKGTTSSDIAVDMICSSNSPCENIELRDIDLKYVGPNKNLRSTSVCKNAKIGYGGIQNPPACR